MAVASLLFALALQATPGSFDPQKSDEAKAASRLCYAKAAISLDDYVSDAATIGRAVSARCSTENQEFLRQIAAGHPEDADKWGDSFKETFETQATLAVLTERRARAQKPN